VFVELLGKHKVLGHFRLQNQFIDTDSTRYRLSLLIFVHLGYGPVLRRTRSRKLVLERTRYVSIYENGAPIVASSERDFVRDLVVLFRITLRQPTQLHQT
jgi:hypothetical protein